MEKVSIVDEEHRLVLPASLPIYQGLLLPVNVLKNSHTTRLTFGSVKTELDIDDISSYIDVYKTLKDVSEIKDHLLFEGKPFVNYNYFILRGNEIIDDIAGQIVNSANSTEVKIARMREFLATALHYVPDHEGVEVPRFFLETLLMRGGDCEDFSIVLGNLLIYLEEVDFGFLGYLELLRHTCLFF